MVARARRDGEARRPAPWRAASWAAAVVAVPLMVFTLAILVTDTVRTRSWTHAGQTLEVLTGDPDCGLAEDLLVPGRADPERTEPLAARLDRDGSATLILPPLVTYFPCARLPELRDGVVEVPDTLVSHPNELSPIRYPLTSPFVGLLDVYRLRELPLSVEENDVPEGVVVYDVEERLPGASYAPVVSSDRAPIITR